MSKTSFFFCAAVFLAATSSVPAQQATCDTCPVAGVESKASAPLGPSDSSHGCTARTKIGFPVPDPNCTPGAVNPTVTIDVLKDPSFRTGCIRNCVTTETEKTATYANYGIPHPANNQGSSQVCELDHLVPLELGGADTLDNIWPQCGPNHAALAKRYFKQKDLVENYVTAQIKAGKLTNNAGNPMTLADAQKAIAADWTQFLGDAKSFCQQTLKQCPLTN